MRNIYLLIFVSFLFISLNAQTVKVYKGSPTVPIYEMTDPDSVLISGDTVMVPDDMDIPNDAIHVYEAINICQKLPHGGMTDSVYHVKGRIVSVDSKTDRGITNYGNAYFYMSDCLGTNQNYRPSFYAYQVMGQNGTKLTSVEQVKVGDYVVVEGKLVNYNGTAETVGKGGASIYSSSNECLKQTDPKLTPIHNLSNAHIIDYIGTNKVQINKGDVDTPVLEFTDADSIVFAETSQEIFIVPAISDEEVNSIVGEGTILNIDDFVDTFMTEKGNWLSDKCPYPNRATNSTDYYVFSIDTIPVGGKSLFIRARIADQYDASPNNPSRFKHYVLQQVIGDQQQTIRMMVAWPDSIGQIGQELLIKVNGLAVGKNADQVYLCMPHYYVAQYFKDLGLQKCGWRPGEIKPKEWHNKIWRIGQPDSSKIIYSPIKISEFISILTSAQRKINGHMVELSDVYFTGQCYAADKSPIYCTIGDPTIDSYANYFAPTTQGGYYPQGRIIMDDNSSCSQTFCYEWSPLAFVQLPTNEFKGKIRGVLTFFYDNARYQPACNCWGILIYNVSSIDFYNSKGEKWTPVYHPSNNQ